MSVTDNHIEAYVWAFLTAFGVASLVVGLCVLLARKYPQIWARKEGRHIHKKDVTRLGGVAMIAGFIVSLLTHPDLIISSTLWGVIIAVIILLFIGLWDDFGKLGWQQQLFFQIAAALLVFILGARIYVITSPFGGVVEFAQATVPSVIVVIVWIVMVTNAMNWVDGIDGLSGGITLIGAGTIFFLSVKPEVNQPPVGIITMALAGCVLGFLIFNFHPAKILAGTTGSMFMGFVLATLAIFAGTKIATALLVMAVPIIDALWVIGARMMAGVSIFAPDKRHLHYRLLDIGWTQKQITLLFYVITLGIATIALNTRTIGKAVTIISVAFLLMGVLFTVSKYIKEEFPEKNEL
ncbi:MAG: undecaprenyl/decaprenyl-phosphate alpha-N-acetylglucosaminyl 1-phosphate transferase [Candidatus Moranbacteria bacterium]|nr:undecaprenyl/decaprenyl-phosphate alpha-N-acetylglucosaminyl 1-phosphate transferase [Candidatus Moranbacteria bacterium]